VPAPGYACGQSHNGRDLHALYRPRRRSPALRELLETYADAVTRLRCAGLGRDLGRRRSGRCPIIPEIGHAGRAAIVAMWTEAMKHYPGISSKPGPAASWWRAIAPRCGPTAEVYDWPDGVHRDRGQYDDACVKIDGRWYFQARTFRNIHRQIGAKGL
jgi:hypothetical protein